MFYSTQTSKAYIQKRFMFECCQFSDLFTLAKTKRLLLYADRVSPLQRRQRLLAVAGTIKNFSSSLGLKWDVTRE